jgi:hypothetical protein
MVYYFWNLKQFWNPPLGASKFVKQRSNLMENEQNMPFRSEGGLCFGFFS